MLRHVPTIIAAVIIYILYNIVYKGQSPDIQSLLIDLVRVAIVTLLVAWLIRVAWSALQRRLRGWARH
jgi:hypothetical protein